MKTRSVTIKDVIFASRFDGKYHNAEVNVYDSLIRKHFDCTLGDCCSDIFTASRGKRVYTDKEHGVPYFSNSDMIASDPFTSCNFISRKYAYEERAVLKENMILTGRVGAIGQIAYVPKYWEQSASMGSDNIYRICIKQGHYSGFLYSYLASRVGNLSFWKLATGGVQPYVTDSMIKTIPIPVFSEEIKKKTDSLIKESSKLRESAYNIVHKAIDYFTKTYPVSGTTQKFFIKSLSELEFSWASYNNNLEVENASKAFGLCSLRIKDLTDKVFAPPLFKHIYLKSDNGYPFMTGSELTQHNLRYYRWLSPRGVKDINDYVVRKGTLLLYKSGTTDGGILGNVFIADDILDGCCLSDHVIRLHFNDIKMAYWTYAFLRSELGVKALQRLATGTMIPFITPERVQRLSIPAPDENFDMVVSAVEEFISIDSQSKRLENQAIDIIEKEIASWSE